MKKKIYIICILLAMFTAISVWQQFWNLFILDICGMVFFIASATSFVAILLCVAILSIKYYRDKRNGVSQKTKLLLCVFLSLFLFFFFQCVVAGSTLSRKCRFQVTQFLRDTDFNRIEVLIDGKKVASKERFMNAISKIESPGAQHYNVNTTIKCEISNSKQEIILRIEQDLFNKNTYHVYYPKYHYTSLNRIGQFYSESNLLE